MLLERANLACMIFNRDKSTQIVKCSKCKKDYKLDKFDKGSTKCPNCGNENFIFMI